MTLSGQAFSRASHGIYRDQFGTFRTAAANVLRDGHYTLDPVTGIYRRSTLLEPQSTNLIPRNRQKFEGWTAYQGAVVTLTQGQTIPGWTPAGAATRIRTTGGTSMLKYYWGGAARGTNYEAVSVVVQNIGVVPVTVSTYGVGTPVTVQPGETRWVQMATAEADPALSSRLRFLAPTAGDSLDILAYAPQVEAAPFCSSPIHDPHATDGATVSRADDQLSFPWPHNWCPMAGFSEFIAGMDDTGGIALPRILHIGAMDGTHPSFQVRHGPGVIVTVAYASSVDHTAASGDADIVVGDRVRVAWALRSDAKVYTAVQVNTGPILANSARDPLSGGIPKAWPKQPWIQFSGWGVSNRGRHEHLCHYICRLSSVANQPGVAPAAKFLAEMAAKAGAP